MLSRGNASPRALGPKPGGESRPCSLPSQSQRKGPKTLVREGYSHHGLSVGPFQNVCPSPIRVLFSTFPLKNSVFSCRTGWTRPRKSRSRSGVSGCGGWDRGGGWAGAPGNEGCSRVAPSYFGTRIRTHEFICFSLKTLREGRALFYSR